MTRRGQSKLCFDQAQELIVGGVNSPVRAFGLVDDDPVFMARGAGSKLYDVDGGEYIDFVNSWGAAMLGHAHSEVLAALTERAAHGLTFGAPTQLETELARVIRRHMPAMEMMRFVSSGTEACMAAIRLARAYTNKPGILKFEGHYHGHSDAMLAGAGSGLATGGIAISAGVTGGAVQDTYTIPFQNEEALLKAFAEHGDKLAGVIFEPMVGNCGFIKPQPEFMAILAQLCERHHVLMIMDEVMTGFRVAMGGAQSVYALRPDITILGKVIGGGMPLACYGGSKEIMALVAPLGRMYQAGTLSGHPVAVQCGLTTLQILADPQHWEHLEQLASQLTEGWRQQAAAYGVPMSTAYQGGMFGYAFRAEAIASKADIDAIPEQYFRIFFTEMLARGVYLPPSPYEACFLSVAHSSEDMDATLAASSEAMAVLAATIKSSAR